MGIAVRSVGFAMAQPAESALPAEDYLPLSATANARAAPLVTTRTEYACPVLLNAIPAPSLTTKPSA